jgi:hypothetical protein
MTSGRFFESTVKTGSRVLAFRNVERSLVFVDTVTVCEYTYIYIYICMSDRYGHLQQTHFIGADCTARRDSLANKIICTAMNDLVSIRDTKI